jgi:nucleotidyltransferase/DNA polymerase involved in DNA repair
VKPRFEVYKAVSQQIREIFAEHKGSQGRTVTLKVKLATLT